MQRDKNSAVQHCFLLLCTEAQRLKCYPLTELYNYIINHIC